MSFNNLSIKDALIYQSGNILFNNYADMWKKSSLNVVQNGGICLSTFLV